MIEKYLILAGSAIILLLGTAHLLGTFFSDMFLPKDKEVLKTIKNAKNPAFDNQSLLNAYIGFNASHSSGAMFFGLVNILLATYHFEIYQNSVALNALNLITLFFLSFVAKKYWFKMPFGGIAIVTALFTVASIMLYL